MFVTTYSVQWEVRIFALYWKVQKFCVNIWSNINYVVKFLSPLVSTLNFPT